MRITEAKFAGSCTRASNKPSRKLPEFAFIGRSNVGKSSLINMLCGNRSCTHYPFLKDVISRISGPDVQVIDPAPAVARHLLDVMTEDGLIREDGSEPFPDVELLASGDVSSARKIFETFIAG